MPYHAVCRQRAWHCRYYRARLSASLRKARHYSMRHLKIEKADNGFATLILDNADESMNMVSDAFIADMEEATAILTEDERVKGVILTSGKKTFMAGADLKQLVRGFGKLTARQAYDFSQIGRASCRESVGELV